MAKMMPRSGNKCFIYGLIMTLALLFLLHSTVNGKLIFCKHCTTPDQRTTEASTLSANIIRAPSKCKSDEVLDHRNKCRRLVYGRN